MQKSHIIIVILFASVALVGLTVTQSFWIVRAINLTEKQHDHRIDMALEDVLNEMGAANNTNLIKSGNPKYTASGQEKTYFEVIDTVLLANLLGKYIDYHRLDQNYEYAIVQTDSDSIMYASAKLIPKSLMKNAHKLCLSSLWKKENTHLAVFFPSQRKEVLVDMSMWLIFSGIFILIIVFLFLYIISTIIRQKKISEIKNDFINNMTHEFKTPISTISLASEVLLNSGTASSSERINKYSKIIYDENLRMRGQVERVLQVAKLDKGEFNLRKSEFNLHQLIRETVQNLCIERCEEQTTVNYHLDAGDYEMSADEMHIRNVVVNLVDNAIKYSSSGAFINIYTRNINEGIVFSIEDHGIGMSSDTVKHIFDKFYRVPTGNIHNVKGFGLGLYYVKNMVSAHGGYIEVHSEPNRGSRFDVFLPLDAPV